MTRVVAAEPSPIGGICSAPNRELTQLLTPPFGAFETDVEYGRPEASHTTVTVTRTICVPGRQPRARPAARPIAASAALRSKLLFAVLEPDGAWPGPSTSSTSGAVACAMWAECNGAAERDGAGAEPSAEGAVPSLDAAPMAVVAAARGGGGGELGMGVTLAAAPWSGDVDA